MKKNLNKKILKLKCLYLKLSRLKNIVNAMKD